MGKPKKSARKPKTAKKGKKINYSLPDYVIDYSKMEEENEFLEFLKGQLRNSRFPLEWNQREAWIEQFEWLDPLLYGDEAIEEEQLVLFFQNFDLLNQLTRQYLQSLPKGKALLYKLDHNNTLNENFNAKLFIQYAHAYLMNHDNFFDYPWNPAFSQNDLDLFAQIQRLWEQAYLILEKPNQKEQEALNAYLTQVRILLNGLNQMEEEASEGPVKDFVRKVFLAAKEHGEPVDDSILKLSEEQLINLLNQQKNIRSDVPDWLKEKLEQ